MASRKNRVHDAFLGRINGVTYYNSNIVSEADFTPEQMEFISLLDMYEDEFEDRRQGVAELEELYGE